MKNLLALFLLLLTINVSAQTKTEDIEKLFELMNSEKMINGVFNNMMPALKQQAQQNLKGEEEQKKFEEYMDFLIEETKSLTRRLMKEMVALYDKHFTHEEIKNMISFYQSDTGKKMIEVTPELSKDLMGIMMENYMPEFQEKLVNKMKELK